MALELKGNMLQSDPDGGLYSMLIMFELLIVPDFNAHYIKI